MQGVLPFSQPKVEARMPIRLREAQIMRRRVRARFDSAETSENNRRHWAFADSLSADAAATRISSAGRCGSTPSSWRQRDEAH